MAWFIQPDSRNRGDEDETQLSPAMRSIPEEQARFEAIGSELGRRIVGDYKALGYDIWDYALMATNPGHPYFSPSSYPKPCQGWRWPIPDEPFRNRLKRKTGRIVDIVTPEFPAYAISQRVIDLIEAIEPGVHQYLPYEMIQPDGSVHPEKRWLLNVCTRADTLDYERSDVIPLKAAPAEYMDRTRFRSIAIRKAEAERRAVWYEYRYVGSSGDFLVSDRLWDALHEAGCAGWRPASFARGDHIPEV